MSKVRMGEMNTVKVGTQTTESFLTNEDQLIPGIPNDITLYHISTKLPWRALYIMSLVSPNWLKAIRSGQVYDARVNTHSTDTLVVHVHYYEDFDDDCEVLALYSMTDERCYELPPIPGYDRGVPWGYRCASLDGKIYVLGGSKIRPWAGAKKYGEKETYALDLARQRQWMQCASMPKRRYAFPCGSVDGKIYVFNDFRKSKFARRFEVYDPKENVWSSIMPNTILSSSPASLIQEMLLNGRNSFVYGKVFVTQGLLLNSYGKVFVAQGKVYLMTGTAMYTKDIETKEWRYLYSSSLDVVQQVLSSEGFVSTPLIVNDELYISVTDADAVETSFQSIGFGSESKEIRWQILPPCSHFIGEVYCTIRL